MSIFHLTWNYIREPFIHMATQELVANVAKHISISLQQSCKGWEKIRTHTGEDVEIGL